MNGRPATRLEQASTDVLENKMTKQTAPEVPHADLIARLREWQRDARTPIQRQDARDAADALAALGGTVPREQMTVDQFREAVGAERASHAARGYDTGHDRAHGVPHLLSWAIDYASRGEAVKSGALIVAALSLSGDLEREERATRAERDALAHVIEQVRGDMHLTQMTADPNDPGAYVLGAAAERAVSTAPDVSLALHDAEVKAQALEEAAAAMADVPGGRVAHQEWLLDRAAVIREEAK